VGSCYGEGELFGLGTISAGCPFFVKGIATDRLSIFDFSFSIKKVINFPFVLFVSVGSAFVRGATG